MDNFQGGAAVLNPPADTVDTGEERERTMAKAQGMTADEAKQAIRDGNKYIKIHADHRGDLWNGTLLRVMNDKYCMVKANHHNHPTRCRLADIQLDQSRNATSARILATRNGQPVDLESVADVGRLAGIGNAVRVADRVAQTITAGAGLESDHPMMIDAAEKFSTAVASQRWDRGPACRTEGCTGKTWRAKKSADPFICDSCGQAIFEDDSHRVRYEQRLGGNIVLPPVVVRGAVGGNSGISADAAVDTDIAVDIHQPAPDATGEAQTPSPMLEHTPAPQPAPESTGTKIVWAGTDVAATLPKSAPVNDDARARDIFPAAPPVKHQVAAADRCWVLMNTLTRGVWKRGAGWLEDLQGIERCSRYAVTADAHRARTTLVGNFPHLAPHIAVLTYTEALDRLTQPGKPVVDVAVDPVMEAAEAYRLAKQNHAAAVVAWEAAKAAVDVADAAMAEAARGVAAAKVALVAAADK